MAQTEGEATRGPQAFTLERISPNPFNGVACVRYAVPRPDHVSLKVFDLLGQPVVTLIDGQVAAGWHEVTWEGRDQAGQSVGSGTYLCRLVSSAGVVARRMTVLR